MAGTRRRLAATATALATAAGLGSVAAADPGQASPQATSAQATITVDLSHPFGALPSDFVGLSFEMRELGVGNFDAHAGNLVALFKNLGHSNVRIAGNTLDRDTLWIPAGQSPPSPLPSWAQDVVTPTDIVRLGHFLSASGWKAEVGINVGHYDPALAADEAKVLSSTLGSRLGGAECGNEPNSWLGKGLRTAPFGYPQYKLDWEACANAAGKTRLAGPDTSSPKSTGPWVASFARDEQTRVKLLTIHSYSIGSTGTVTDLLSANTDASELSSVSSELAAAKSVKLPIRIDETNSAAGGGIAGVSDTYASALWSMDYSLLMAQDGFSGLNFHGGLGVCDAALFNGKFQIYTPICAANAADESAKIYQAMPEYYGLYMASRMGSGEFLPVTLSDASGATPNITAYAVRGTDGKTRIAVIEKDATSAAPVPLSIKVGKSNHAADVVHLTGSSLGSAQGVAVQGATVSRAGQLAQKPGSLLHVHDGTLNFTMASGSAVIITLSGNG
jgi:hypothetical protein